jgi:hypothetical protein
MIVQLDFAEHSVGGTNLHGRGGHDKKLKPKYLFGLPTKKKFGPTT